MLVSIVDEEMTGKYGSIRQSFLDQNREQLLSRKGHSDFGLHGNDDAGADDNGKCRCFCTVSDAITNFWKGLHDTTVKLYDMSRSDPRKFYFAAKMGLSLALTSLVIFIREPLKEVAQYSIWAILTVVVVFEFSVGMVNDFLSIWGFFEVLCVIFFFQGNNRVDFCRGNAE